MRALNANIEEEHVTLKHSVGKGSKPRQKGDGAREREGEQSGWETAGNSLALPLLTGQGGSYNLLMSISNFPAQCLPSDCSGPVPGLAVLIHTILVPKGQQ